MQIAEKLFNLGSVSIVSADVFACRHVFDVSDNRQMLENQIFVAASNPRAKLDRHLPCRAYSLCGPEAEEMAMGVCAGTDFRSIHYAPAFA